jgi:hypothetical protein
MKLVIKTRKVKNANEEKIIEQNKKRVVWTAIRLQNGLDFCMMLVCSLAFWVYIYVKIKSFDRFPHIQITRRACVYK